MQDFSGDMGEVDLKEKLRDNGTFLCHCDFKLHWSYWQFCIGSWEDLYNL